MNNEAFHKAKAEFARTVGATDLNLVRPNFDKEPEGALKQAALLTLVGMISSTGEPVEYNEGETSETLLYATFSVDPEDCITPEGEGGTVDEEE